jgi:hypothetical protein
MRRLTNVKVAADYAKLSVSFLNKARCTGDGPPFIKLGKRVIYDLDDLDRWIDQGRRKSTGQRDVAA